jgi:hypothetical protein
MKRLFLTLLLLLVCAIYIIPLLIITVLAYLCMFIGVNQDLTSTRFVVWFITPLTHLEKKINKKKVHL